MGKPSSYKLAKKSDHYFSLSSSYQKIPAPMSSHKMEKIKRKKHNKTKNKIRNIFNKLKKQSENSFDSSFDVTVIASDNNNEQSDRVINENIPVATGHKRKHSLTSIQSAKRRKSDSSLILIEDDVTTNNGPCTLTSPSRNEMHINCSTPINKRDSKSLRNLIIDNFPAPNSNESSKTKINEDIINLTKEINRDSYLTIDLTAESEANKTNDVVIDLDKTHDYTTQTEADCTVISVSNTSLSMSGDSEVTVLQNKRNKKDKQINKFARGISKLNSNEKGKLLEIIAQNIFNGCNMTSDIKNSLSKIKTSQTQGTETAQDTFIKEVILGETKSRNSVGSNIYHPSRDVSNKKGLRMIVIDGSNVAMEHTKGNTFSVKGLKICIDYFLRRGHVVKAFVPRFRCKYGKSSDPKLLDQLERQGLVVYTPSREIKGRICVPYDDRYIVQCAAEFDGIIVSGDNYRDLLQENPRWQFVIENRLLPFTWVDDMIMFPKDPLGRNGPTLEQFLKHQPSSQVVHIL